MSTVKRWAPLVVFVIIAYLVWTRFVAKRV